MEVSVIIVNYHSADLTIDCIDSIFEKTRDVSYEIIVVDNASNDGSVEKLKHIYNDKIKIISSDINLGFGKANNLGVKYALGEYLFLLNPDTILVNNAIKILRDALLNDKKAGSVGGNLYTREMMPCPSYSLKFDDIESEKKYSSWFFIISDKIKRKYLNDKNKQWSQSFNYNSQPIPVAYVFGADMMMKKELYEELGGFDPDFFMYGEEQELSWRIILSGKNNFNIPHAKIIHLEGATLKEQNSFSERQFKMRMTGAMTLFKKRFGVEGIDKFYRYRSRRYERMISIAKLKRKNIENFAPAIQLMCLKDAYGQMNKNDK